MKGQCSVLHVSRDAGTTWALIGKIYNLTGGGQSREINEDDALLDCVNNSPAVKTKAGGAKTLGDLSAEVRWNPATIAGNNSENHQILKEMFDLNETGYFRITYTDAQASGEIWSAFVSELGEVSLVPDGSQVRRSFTFTPDGNYHTQAENIAAVVIGP